MALPDPTPAQDEQFVAGDLPIDDPATISPDEGDIGHDATDAAVSEPVAEAHMLRAALTPGQLAQERQFAVQAAQVALAHRAAVHYTQNASQRWDGIDHGLLGMQGHYPRYADCSSFVTWCLWNGMRIHHQPDTVNGTNWRSGYTGTQLRHGTQVAERNVLPGDLAFYGSGFPGKHVAICIGHGLVISHGSEAGPLQLPLHYRSDFMQIRRYIGASVTPPPPHPRTVAQQQQAVNGLGYHPPLVVDNHYGPKTKAGIQWLQHKVGTIPDGIWGPDTEAKYQTYIHTHRP
jgi:cell wall-associated NlpC family hydrolase